MLKHHALPLLAARASTGKAPGALYGHFVLLCRFESRTSASMPGCRGSDNSLDISTPASIRSLPHRQVTVRPILLTSRSQATQAPTHWLHAKNAQASLCE